MPWEYPPLHCTRAGGKTAGLQQETRDVTGMRHGDGMTVDIRDMKETAPRAAVKRGVRVAAAVRAPWRQRTDVQRVWKRSRSRSAAVERSSAAARSAVASSCPKDGARWVSVSTVIGSSSGRIGTRT